MPAIAKIKTIDIAPNIPSEEIPKRVSLTWMIQRIGKSDRQLIHYRRLAFLHISAYKQSCLLRNPGYFDALLKQFAKEDAGERVKKIMPDVPPFTEVEARILIKLSELFTEWRDEKLVIARIEQNPNFWNS